MKTIRYGCTHCGRKFEAEEKDIVECPGCFWTSSVKPEEDLPEFAAGSKAEKGAKAPFVFPSLPWKPIAGILLLLAAGFLAVKFAVPVMGKLKSAAQTSASKPKKEKSQAKSQTGKPQEAAVSGVAGLSAEDQNILKRRIQLSPERVLSEEETKVLETRAPFKSGFSEKLPSQPWTLENFKEMVAQQEKFYQVPLPRSYKNKLYDLFKAKYLPGAEAFKNGDLILARNNWAESLAFPVYSTNPEKHRGVVLTMLRPFITDTLSKIGTINSASVEKGVREKEEAVLQGYEKLFALIKSKSWPAAIAAIGELNQHLDAVSNPSRAAGGPTAYHKGIHLVDRDIQAALMGLLTVPPPAVSDLEPIRIDLARKKRVMEGLIPENLSARQQKYDEGMDALAHGDFAAAEKNFKEVDLPFELYEDAAEKIKILKRLNPSHQEGQGAA